MRMDLRWDPELQASEPGTNVEDVDQALRPRKERKIRNPKDVM